MHGASGAFVELVEEEGETEMGAFDAAGTHSSHEKGRGEGVPPSVETLLKVAAGGSGKFQKRVLLITGLSFAADSLEVSLLSFLSACAGQTLGFDSLEANWLTSSVFMGELLGSQCWGVVGDHYGRLQAYRLCLLCVSIFGVSSAAAPSFSLLLAFRFMVGFGIGGLNVPFDLLAEIVPRESRGNFLCVIQAFWCLGSIGSVSTAWMTASLGLSWRYLTALCALPAALSLLLLRFVPESPRWLLSKGRTVEALDTIEWMARTNGVSIDAHESLQVLFMEMAEDGGRENFLDGGSEDGGGDIHEAGCLNVCELLGGHLRFITVPLWLLWAAWAFLYYGIVLLASRMFELSGDDEDEEQCSFDYGTILIISLSEVLGIGLLFALLGILGRRGSQAASYSLVGLLALPLALSATSWTTEVGLLFLMRASLMFGTSASWIAAPELYPTQVRGTAHAYANAMARLGAFASPFVMDSYHLGRSWKMTVAFVASIVSTICALILPETQGVSL